MEQVENKAERKRIEIKFYRFTYKSLGYWLYYDTNTLRQVDIELSDNKLQSLPVFRRRYMGKLVEEMIKRSGWPLEMTYSEFLDLTFTDFPGVKISNKLIMK